jgi:hypothetical protein
MRQRYGLWWEPKGSEAYGHITLQYPRPSVCKTPCHEQGSIEEAGNDYKNKQIQ